MMPQDIIDLWLEDKEHVVRMLIIHNFPDPIKNGEGSTWAEAQP